MKVRGPGHPCVNLPAQQPFRFDHLRGSLIGDAFGDGGSTVNYHHIGPQEAKTAIDIGEAKGLHHLSSLPLPQIEGSGATGAHYQWLTQCCPGLIDQMDTRIPDEGDGTKRMELT